MMSRVIVPEPQRDGLNDVIRQQAPDICDGFIDIAADPLLGANGAYADGYFADETHPNDQGQQEVAGIITRYINSVAGANAMAPLVQSAQTYSMTVSYTHL